MFEQYGILVDFNFRAQGNAATQLRGLITEMQKFPGAAGNITKALEASARAEVKMLNDVAALRGRLTTRDANGVTINSLEDMLIGSSKGFGRVGLSARLSKVRSELQNYVNGVTTEYNKALAFLQRTMRNSRGGSLIDVEERMWQGLATNLETGKVGYIPGRASRFGRESGYGSTFTGLLTQQAALQRSSAALGNLDQTLYATRQIGASAQAATRSITELSAATDRMNNLFGRTAVAMMVFYQMNALITATVESSRALEKSLTATQAILGTSSFIGQGSQTNYRQMHEDVRRLSNELGVSALEVSKALNVVFQGTDISTRGALEITKVATQTAKITQSSVDTITNILVAAKNAFNLPASDIVKVSEKLILLWKDGVVNLDQLENGLGKVFKAGRLFGAKTTDDMNTLFTWTAAITKEAGSAANNVTQLQNVLIDFSRPKIREALQGKGIDFGIGGTEFERNKNAVLQVLQRGEAFISANFGKQRTALGLSTLMSEMQRGYFEQGMATFEGSAGVLRDALETVMDKPTARMERLVNVVGNFKTMIGRDLVTTLDAIVAPLVTIDKVTGEWNEKLPGIKILTSAFRGLFEVVSGLGMLNMGLMAGQMLMGVNVPSRMGGNLATAMGDRMRALGYGIFGRAQSGFNLEEGVRLQNMMRTAQLGGMSVQQMMSDEAMLAQMAKLGLTESSIINAGFARNPLPTGGMYSGAYSLRSNRRTYVPTGIGNRVQFASQAQIAAMRAGGIAGTAANEAAISAQSAAMSTGMVAASTSGATLSAVLGGVTIAIIAATSATAIYNGILDTLSKTAEDNRRDLEDYQESLTQSTEIMQQFAEATKYAKETGSTSDMAKILSDEFEKNAGLMEALKMGVEWEGTDPFITLMGKRITSVQDLEDAMQQFEVTKFQQALDQMTIDLEEFTRSAGQAILWKNEWWRMILNALFQGVPGGAGQMPAGLMGAGSQKQLEDLAASSEFERGKLGAGGKKALDEWYEYKGAIKENTKSAEDLAEDTEETAKEVDNAKKHWESVWKKVEQTGKIIDTTIQFELQTGAITEQQVPERRRQLEKDMYLSQLKEIMVGVVTDETGVAKDSLAANQDSYNYLVQIADSYGVIAEEALKQEEAAALLTKQMSLAAEKIDSFAQNIQDSMSKILGLGQLGSDKYGLQQGAIGLLQDFTNAIIPLNITGGGAAVAQNINTLMYGQNYMEAARQNLQGSVNTAYYARLRANTYTRSMAGMAIQNLGGLKGTQYESGVTAIDQLMQGILNNPHLSEKAKAASIAALLRSLDTFTATNLQTGENVNVFGSPNTAGRKAFYEALGLGDLANYNEDIVLPESAASVLGTLEKSLTNNPIFEQESQSQRLVEAGAEAYNSAMLKIINDVITLASSKVGEMEPEDAASLRALEANLTEELGWFSDIKGKLREYQAMGLDAGVFKKPWTQEEYDARKAKYPGLPGIEELNSNINMVQITESDAVGQYISWLLDWLDTKKKDLSYLTSGDMTKSDLAELLTGAQEASQEQLVEQGKKSNEDLAAIQGLYQDHISLWETMNSDLILAQTSLAALPGKMTEMLTSFDTFVANLNSMAENLKAEIAAMKGNLADLSALDLTTLPNPENSTETLPNGPPPISGVGNSDDLFNGKPPPKGASYVGGGFAGAQINRMISAADCPGGT